MTLNPTQPTPRLHRAAPSFMSRPGPTGDAPRLAPPDPDPAVVAALSRWARARGEREVAAVVRWSGDRRRRAEARDHARACEALTASEAARGGWYPAYGVPEVAASGARQVRCHAGSCQLQDAVDSCLSRHAKTSAPREPSGHAVADLEAPHRAARVQAILKVTNGSCPRRRSVIAPIARCGPRRPATLPQHNVGRSSRQLGRCTDAILPALFPFEVSGNQVVKPVTVDEVIESPASRDVTDYQHTLSFPTQLKITKEAADPHHRLPPGLSARVRRIEKLHLVCVQKRRRHPVAFAVVALSEPPVMKDWEAGAIERDSRRLHCTSKIRREDGRESVV